MKLKNKLIPLASVITAAAAVVPLTVSCGTNTNEDNGFVDLTEPYGTKLGYLDCTDQGVDEIVATAKYAESVLDNPEIFVEDYLWFYSTQISDIQDKQDTWQEMVAERKEAPELEIKPSADDKKKEYPAKPIVEHNPGELFKYESKIGKSSDEELQAMYEASHMIADAYNKMAEDLETAEITKEDIDPFVGNAEEHKVRFNNVTADKYDFEDEDYNWWTVPVISFDVDYTIFYTYDDVKILNELGSKVNLASAVSQKAVEEQIAVGGERRVAMVEQGNIQFKDIPFQVIWEDENYHSWMVKPFMSLLNSKEGFAEYTATFTPEVILNYGVATQNTKFSMLGAMEYVTNSDFNYTINEDSLQGKDGQIYATMFSETCKTFSPMSHYLLTLPSDHQKR